jgi:hypothetical protein
MARGSGVDGRYDHTKPWSQRPPFQPDQVAKRWQYSGPWSSNEERLTSQALMVMNIPGADISKMVRPPLPQIRLFPDRYGYDRRTIGIDDIVSIDRNYVEPRVGWYSGGVAGYSGSSRNDLGAN